MDAYKFTATEALSQIQPGELSVEQYAQSLLARVEKRDSVVKAWAHLDPELVIAQARELTKVPKELRGPLHGIAIGVNDVIYTKGLLPDGLAAAVKFRLTPNQICQQHITQLYTKEAFPRLTLPRSRLFDTLERSYLVRSERLVWVTFLRV